MINLETFFRLHFDSKNISDDNLKKFAQDHIQRLIANNPGNKYATMINDTVIGYDGYFGSITDEYTATALKEGRTIVVDTLFKEFQDAVSQKEGIIRGTYGLGTLDYEAFFPQGLTEYANATKGTVETLMTNMVNVSILHVADLGQPFVDLFVQLRTDYIAARDAQLNQIGIVEGDKTKTATTRDTLEIQLGRNVLLLAYDFIGKPDMVNDYFDQSIIPKWASGGDEGDNGGEPPAPQATITLATNQTNPTPVNIALLGGDGEEVVADYGNNTSETKTVNSSTYTLFSILYNIAGNYAIKLMGNVAAFLEIFLPDAKITAINLPEGINISALDLLNNLLTSFFLPLSCINMINLQLNNNALDQQSVNQILIQLAANGLSNGMVNLAGGTNAAPSGQGIAAMNQLISRGWNVITN